MTARTQGLAMLVAAAVLGTVTRAQPVGTAFTYQGNLKVAGQPASGLHDLQLQLFTAAAGGTQVGATICRDGVNVVDGLFTVSLDFGSAYDGDQRFLQIGVRADATAGNCAGGAYTALSPRQALSAVPYALKVPGIDGHSLDAADGSPKDRVYVDADGDVGIGTTTPAFSLDARGDSFRFDLSQDGGGKFVIANNPNDNRVYLEAFDSAGANANAFMVLSGAGGAAVPNLSMLANTAYLSGNVGIGTTAPTQPLHVAGTIRSSSGGFMFPDGTTQTTAATGAGFWSASGTHIYKNNSGNVGIGTTAPQSPLHLIAPNTGPFSGEGVRIQGTVSSITNLAYMSFLNGAGTAMGYVGDGSTGDNNVFLGAYLGDVCLITSTRALTAKQDGKVGVGTTSPGFRLDVLAAGFDGDGVRVSGAAGRSPGFIVAGPSGRGFLGQAETIYGWSGNADPGDVVLGADQGKLLLQTGIGAADIAIVGNNVGIGTAAPAAKLDVAGTTRTQVLEITGADLAEKFPSSEKVEPGMVTAIDVANAGKLCLARGAYNRCVAGVVSGANDFSVGAVLGNLPGSEDAPPIALSGRVYVWCDATSAPIQPGDLLTTSDAPGHAMKAVDRERSHGAVIGKAMSALPRGERGLVLTLVNLQ